MSEAKAINGEIYLNGYLRATLIGFAGFVVAGFIFIGTSVIANDGKSVEEHIRIRREMWQGDQNVLNKIEDKLDRLETKIDRVLQRGSILP